MARPKQGPRIGPSPNPAGYYELLWRDAHGQRRRQATEYKDAATAHAALPRLVAELLAGGHTIEGIETHPVAFPPPSQIEAPVRASNCPTVADCAAFYLEHHAAKSRVPNALRDAANALRGPVWWLGDIPVDQLTAHDLDRYTQDRLAGITRLIQGEAPPRFRRCSEGTVRNHLLRLKTAISYAKERHALPSDISLPKFPKLKASQARVRWLTKTEAASLIQRAKAESPDQIGQHFLITMIGLTTAQRVGAICELKWDQVNFGLNMIDFNPVGRVRTRKRRAHLPIPNELRPILEQRFRERDPSCPYVVPRKPSPYRSYLAFLRAAGVVHTKGEGAHLLRHTWASWQVQSGTPLAMIAKVLCDTVEVVEKHYAMVSPDDVAAATNKIRVLALDANHAPTPSALPPATLGLPDHSGESERRAG